MNISKYKDLAELLALVAVIGSLIAVTIELRQTQEALQAEAYQTRALDGIATNLIMAQDERLDRLMSVLTSPDFDPDDLSETEYRTAISLMTVTRIDVDNEHYQFQKGFLDPGFYHGETEQRMRDEAPIWRALGIGEPRPDFRKEVDRLLAEPAISVTH